jgi:hypothetical protein
MKPSDNSVLGFNVPLEQFLTEFREAIRGDFASSFLLYVAVLLQLSYVVVHTPW